MTDAPGELRPAVPADGPRLQDVVDAAYRGYLPRMDRPPAPMSHDLGPDIAACGVWVTGDPIVGLICLTVLEDSVLEGSLLIENVAVDPAAQGAGIGRLLLRFAEQQAGRLGASTLELYTNAVMTENLAIYAHLGYREVDRRTEHGFDRVFLRKDLSLPV